MHISIACLKKIWNTSYCILYNDTKTLAQLNNAIKLIKMLNKLSKCKATEIIKIKFVTNFYTCSFPKIIISAKIM